MTDALSMDQVADRLGYSWERFRKVWRALPGFPAPFKRPALSGKGTYAWREAPVEAWRLARERAFGAGAADLTPANDLHAPRAAHVNAVQRQRAERAKIMSRR